MKPAHSPRFAVIESHEPRADDWRTRKNGEAHVGEAQVDAITRSSGCNLRVIRDRSGLADVAPIARCFELHRFRSGRRTRCGGSNEIAIRSASAAREMPKLTGLRRDLCNRDIPSLRRGLHQHVSRSRAGSSHALLPAGERETAARDDFTVTRIRRDLHESAASCGSTSNSSASSVRRPVCAPWPISTRDVRRRMAPSAYSSSHQLGDSGRDAAPRSQLANVRPRPPKYDELRELSAREGEVRHRSKGASPLGMTVRQHYSAAMKPTSTRATQRWDERPFFGMKFWLPGSVILFAALAAYCEVCTVLAGLPRPGIAVSGSWALQIAMGWAIVGGCLGRYGARVADAPWVRARPARFDGDRRAGYRRIHPRDGVGYQRSCAATRSELLALLEVRGPMTLVGSALLLGIFAIRRRLRRRSDARFARSHDRHRPRGDCDGGDRVPRSRRQLSQRRARLRPHLPAAVDDAGGGAAARAAGSCVSTGR